MQKDKYFPSRERERKGKIEEVTRMEEEVRGAGKKGEETKHGVGVDTMRSSKMSRNEDTEHNLKWERVGGADTPRGGKDVPSEGKQNRIDANTDTNTKIHQVI